MIFASSDKLGCLGQSLTCTLLCEGDQAYSSILIPVKVKQRVEMDCEAEQLRVGDDISKKATGFESNIFGRKTLAIYRQAEPGWSTENVGIPSFYRSGDSTNKACSFD